ncbi:MAG: MetQ/NlpA family ABC transporter substrate-binding protein [bacterium]
MKKVISSLLAVLLFALMGCSSSKKDADLEKLTVAATPAPHAEILNHVADQLKEKGYALEVIEYTDYVQPNNVVESGEIDANYFQHTPYLTQFNADNGTHLVVAGKIHYEPMGIYKGKKDSLDALEKGDEIAIPNDTTNEARALQLLEANKVITLKAGVGLNATIKDIESNPKGIKFTELEAALVPKKIDEFAFVIANGNYALEEGLKLDDTVAVEAADSDSATTYVNIVAVKEGNENSEKIKALIDVLTSDETKKWITEKYGGSVLPFAE